MSDQPNGFVALRTTLILTGGVLSAASAVAAVSAWGLSIHSSQPHNGAVLREEFQTTLDSINTHLHEIRQDVRELRQAQQRP